MIALTSQTAAAVALHAADGSWVMFMQALQIGVMPIRIEGIHGADLLARLSTLTDDNFAEIQLVGIIPSDAPERDALAIANEFAPYQIRGWWFEPKPPLLSYIEEQSVLSQLLMQTHPGGLSDAPVGIEDIADVIGVSVPTVRRMIKANEIPYLKFGRIYRFVPNDVLASLRMK